MGMQLVGTHESLINAGAISRSVHLPCERHAAIRLCADSCSWRAGIYYSDDKLLQTRIFSYPDTQRHRLGPNYLLLPANAPKCTYHNNHHEGFMNFTHRDEEVRQLSPAWRVSADGCNIVLVGLFPARSHRFASLSFMPGSAHVS